MPTVKQQLIVAGLVLSCALSANAEVLCVKKTISVSDGKISMRGAFAERNGACTSRQYTVSQDDSAAEVLAKIGEVDGTGSTLDADLLDGNSAEAFASADAQTALEARMTVAESDIDTVQTSLGTHDTDIAELDSAVATLQSSVSGHDSSISSLNSSVSTLSTENDDTYNYAYSLSPGARVVRVGTSGTTYTSLATAITYVNTQSRSTTNRWVIQVGPGTHSAGASALTIPTYTTIRGSGRHSTIISGSYSGGSGGVLVMSTGSSISDLTVENYSTGDYATAIYAGNIQAADDTEPTGIELRIERVLARSMTAATYAWTIHNSQADLVLDDVDILSGNSTQLATGLSISSSAGRTYLRNVRVSVKDSDGGCAHHCQGLATTAAELLDIKDSRFYGYERGVYASGDGIVRFTGSRVTGYQYAIVTDGNADLRLSNSELYSMWDPDVGGASSVACTFSTTIYGTALASDCT